LELDYTLLAGGRERDGTLVAISGDLMSEAKKARMVGFNHVALEVGDIDAALAFYRRLFDFELRSKTDSMAFIDLGDQFLALQKGRRQPADDGRHFGLVVDDKEAVRTALVEAGVEIVPGPFLDFLDPWGNRFEIVGYDNIQFTKAANVLGGMGLAHLSKNDSALKELADKGMARQNRHELIVRSKKAAPGSRIRRHSAVHPSAARPVSRHWEFAPSLP
jgi:predicted enzyme related to lactoylglutathione lyase